MKKNSIIAVGVIIVLSIVAWIFYFPTGDVINDLGEGYMDISAVEAKDLVDNNPELIIIDVSPFYEDGHIPGAVWHYYKDGSLDSAIPTLDPNSMYLVYCHFDGPSRNGAQKLIDAGFMNVYRLTDHFSGWKDSGYIIEY